ncbi:MAG: IPT/TIG domain-containing protein [Acidobacteriota bacterium]
MHRYSSALLVALFWCASVHAQPFQVLSITPFVGSTLGGNRVVFQLDDIPFCFDPVPGTELFFGGVAATSVTVDETTKKITAVTPQHEPGVVDVLVQTCGGPQVLVPNGFIYDPNAPDPNGYEKVLFPIVFSGLGALGSEWDTKISVYNSGDEPVDSAQPIFEGDPRSACPSVCGCGVSNTVEPRSTREVCVDGFQDPAGLIYYPRRRFAGQLAFGSRVFDTSRSQENFGTEIPVVRECEFRTDQIALLNVPLHGRQRVALRVYDPDQHRSAQVAMTILDGVTGETIASATITTEYSIVTILPDPFPIRPGFAYLGDLDRVVTAMLPAGAQIDRFHVLLTPLTPGLRFWAFVSVTNNDTQVVTTVTPQ